MFSMFRARYVDITPVFQITQLIAWCTFKLLRGVKVPIHTMVYFWIHHSMLRTRVNLSIFTIVAKISSRWRHSFYNNLCHAKWKSTSEFYWKDNLWCLNVEAILGSGKPAQRCTTDNRWNFNLTAEARRNATSVVPHNEIFTADDRYIDDVENFI